jgi:hypothetical protein
MAGQEQIVARLHHPGEAHKEHAVYAQHCMPITATSTYVSPKAPITRRGLWRVGTHRQQEPT